MTAIAFLMLIIGLVLMVLDMNGAIPSIFGIIGAVVTISLLIPMLIYVFIILWRYFP